MYRHTPETELQRTIRLMYENPQEFDPEKLPVSEIVQPNGLIIAKIPQIPGRIARRKMQGSDGYYIELILSRGYNPQTRQNRNKKVIIGTEHPGHLRGMMFANGNYRYHPTRKEKPTKCS